MLTCLGLAVPSDLPAVWLETKLYDLLARPPDRLMLFNSPPWSGLTALAPGPRWCSPPKATHLGEFKVKVDCMLLFTRATNFPLFYTADALCERRRVAELVFE